MAPAQQHIKTFQYPADHHAILKQEPVTMECCQDLLLIKIVAYFAYHARCHGEEALIMALA